MPNKQIIRGQSLQIPKGQRIQYDYTNQAWLVDGRYRRCGHPAKDNCRCFGRLHEGEKAQKGAMIR